MPRIITPLQELILQTLQETKSQLTHAFYLSGGTALSEYHFQHRYSEDLDLFVRIVTDSAVDLRPDAELLSEQLRARGLAVSSLQHYPTKIRLAVESTAENTLVDMVTDYGPNLSSLSDLESIPVDSYEDMASRKLVAFLERGR